MKSARSILILGCALMCSCADRPKTITLDEVGKQFVFLGLELGEYDETYIDSYVGPAEWQKRAQEEVRSKAELAQAAADLLTTVESFEPASEEQANRQRLLIGKVRAMEARTRMLLGEKFSFAEEARLLFDANPSQADFSDFDRVLAEIDKIVPGEGALNDRIDALRATVLIPENKLDIVLRTAIEECRQRTTRYIALPEDERFQLEYVSGVSWGGHLEYLGDHESLMSIGVGSPRTLSGAVNIACHEGYPGHHVYNLLLDERFLRELDWTEFQLQPSYAPAMLIHEGSAEYGVSLAFPGDESVVFQRDVLAPIAGIDPDRVQSWHEYVKVSNQLGNQAFSAIAQQYVDGEITRDEALQKCIKYILNTPEQAENSVQFIEMVRSYVLNYSLGEHVVSAYVESQGASIADRWAAYKHVIENQPTANDLTRLY